MTGIGTWWKQKQADAQARADAKDPKKVAAAKQAVFEAELRERTIVLGTHLRENIEVSATTLDLAPFALNEWTPADLDAALAAVNDDKDYLLALLKAATEASTSSTSQGIMEAIMRGDSAQVLAMSSITRKAENSPALTPDGVVLWGSLALDILDKREISQFRSKVDEFKTILGDMKRYSSVGDHVYAAWAHAAGMSADEAAAQRTRGEMTTADLQMLAGLLGCVLPPIGVSDAGSS